MATEIKEVFPGETIFAEDMNQVIGTANRVNGMSGNVIHSPIGIHIPFPSRIKTIPLAYKTVPARCRAGETHFVGSVVRVVQAYKPVNNIDLYDNWVAFVCNVEATDEATFAKGHLGYAIVTKQIDYDGDAGEIAIYGEVPAIVKQPSGLTAVAPGYRYAVIDVNGAEPKYLQIYGKLKSGTVPAFRVLYEDTSGTLTDAHWALVKVDMGNEIDDQCITVKNDYASSITDGQPAEITGDEDGYLVVDRPSEDSIPAPRIVFPVGIVGASGDNPYGFARAGNEPIWVTYTGDAPAIGDEVGTTTDSFAFTKGNTGFMCVGVDTGGSKCLVRPFSRGAGGLRLIQTYIVSATYPQNAPGSGTYSYETTKYNIDEFSFATSTVLAVPILHLSAMQFRVDVGTATNIGDFKVEIYFYDAGDTLVASSILCLADIPPPSFSASGYLEATKVRGGLVSIIDDTNPITKVAFKFTSFVQGPGTYTFAATYSGGSPYIVIE